MYSNEWQKRGLPHAHILIWLKMKINSFQIINVINEEISNPEESPLLDQSGEINEKFICFY